MRTGNMQEGKSSCLVNDYSSFFFAFFAAFSVSLIPLFPSSTPFFPPFFPISTPFFPTFSPTSNPFFATSSVFFLSFFKNGKIYSSAEKSVSFAFNLSLHKVVLCDIVFLSLAAYFYAHKTWLAVYKKK